MGLEAIQDPFLAANLAPPAEYDYLQPPCQARNDQILMTSARYMANIAVIVILKAYILR